MTTGSRLPSTLVETFLATIVAGGVAYCIWHLCVYYYLPQPFFYEPDDLFADWFNTAYWAHDSGTYDSWQTIYPPISFVFLSLLGNGKCYPVGSLGLAARECDYLGFVAIFGVFLINLYLIYRVFRKWDRRTCIQRTICLAFGLPMLDGLERGNLVMVSFSMLLLGFAPLLKSAKARWVCAGLAVNFKVYLIAPIFAMLVRRKWRWTESALISVITCYLLSFAALGRGTPIEIYSNIVYFASQPPTQILDLWYSTTYNALMALMSSDTFPFISLIGSRNLYLALMLVPLAQHITQFLILFAAGFACFRPEAVTSYRIINLSLLMVVVTAEPGGYTMIYFMLFTLLESWRSLPQKIAICCCYLLAITLDIPIDNAAQAVRDTYVGHSTAIITFKIMLGPFIRPGLIMILAQSLAILTIREVWHDIRQDGWAGRWRFRQDVPLFPWVRRPMPIEVTGQAQD